MADPTLAVHKALIAAINGVVTCSVYDGVPQGASYPYVTLDFTVADNDDYTNSRQDRRFVYLGIWSRAGGQEEIYTIMGQIDTLHEQPLTLDTGQLVSLRVERKRTSREPDNKTFMGQITLRIITTH